MASIGFGFDRGTNRTNHRAPRPHSQPSLLVNLPGRPTPAAAAGQWHEPRRHRHRFPNHHHKIKYNKIALFLYLTTCFLFKQPFPSSPVCIQERRLLSIWQAVARLSPSIAMAIKVAGDPQN
jgi:hypothetical protein